MAAGGWGGEACLKGGVKGVFKGIITPRLDASANKHPLPFPPLLTFKKR